MAESALIAHLQVMRQAQVKRSVAKKVRQKASKGRSKSKIDDDNGKGCKGKKEDKVRQQDRMPQKRPRQCEGKSIDVKISRIKWATSRPVQQRFFLDV